MVQEVEIATISEKWQVVIPKKIRESTNMKPRTKVAFFQRQGLVIMKTFEVPDMEKEWSKIFENMDKKNLRLSEKQVNGEIRKHRTKK